MASERVMPCFRSFDSALASSHSKSIRRTPASPYLAYRNGCYAGRLSGVPIRRLTGSCGCGHGNPSLRWIEDFPASVADHPGAAMSDDCRPLTSDLSLLPRRHFLREAAGGLGAL